MCRLVLHDISGSYLLLKPGAGNYYTALSTPGLENLHNGIDKKVMLSLFKSTATLTFFFYSLQPNTSG